MPNPKNLSLRKLKNRKAFSLIELSIVLIIIGLLVAGVTGGASLINSATLRGTMNEARGYSVAVNSFFVKYNSLPGDYSSVIGTFTGSPAGTTGGNANGFIEFINAGSTAAGRMESNIAWQQLKNEGIVDALFTPGNTDATTATTYTQVLTPGFTGTATATAAGLPGSKTKSAGWVFDYISAISQNVVILTGAPGTTYSPTMAASTVSNVIPVGIITPADSFSIDVKMDDGVPTAGKIRGSSLVTSPANAVGTAGTSAPATGCYYNNTTQVKDLYNTSNSAKACALTFQVDVNS